MNELYIFPRARRRCAAKRRREAKRDPFTYCQLPKTTRQGLVWDEIELLASKTSKGTGLFAKKDLPQNLCIPYGGIYRTPQEHASLVRHSNDRDRHLTSHGASVRIKNAEGAYEWGMQDAHPRIMQERKIPAGAWPGGYCNQADQPEAQNAELLQHEGICTAPVYAWMDEKSHNLFVKLKRPVPAGEEILVDYAYSARKQTVLGFEFKARRPKVTSEYEFRPRKKVGKYGDIQVVG